MGEIQKSEKGLMSQQDLEVLVRSSVIPQGTPVPQVQLFAKVCAQKEMDPFSKQIYLIKRGGKKGDTYTIQMSVDGYRTIAERSGAYAGSDDYTFNDGMTEFQCRKGGDKNPIVATATVYKTVNGEKVAFTATAAWDSYCAGTPIWNKYPFLMLGKCAESLALRKAFPEAFSGIHTDEEMEAAPRTKTQQRDEIIASQAPDEEELLKEALEAIKECDSVASLQATHASYPALHSNEEFMGELSAKRKEIESATKEAKDE